MTDRIERATVRSRSGALAFYRRLGFAECGRLRAQVVIDDCEDDEIVLEYFLQRG